MLPTFVMLLRTLSTKEPKSCYNMPILARMSPFEWACALLPLA